MMHSTQKIGRQIVTTAAKQIDISLYKGLNLNIPILHTRPTEPLQEQKEKEYSMELEAMTMQLPSGLHRR